ncbi:putative RNA 2'-phosphotransferase [Pustulibacterium marinum]|uniref:Probable RNA 2'-phosphotransferase n=1 Tax=Pustulibacterium marinum TaxID=1224947 RepID=A0A1I7I1I5_9FLAO|nr:RNA 2'-phosphotransferase [Pustulibacterium marinum]SFU66804.1 putative RNA 2'-phosphotransferase [Pustulibacterium marinum]
MNSKKAQKISKYLSLILRHQPEVIGISLDENGWANTQELLTNIQSDTFQLTLEELKWVVDNSDKKRFVLSPNDEKIRANQGHSVNIDLGLVAKVPPEILYHGTAERNIASIKKQGLLKGQRHHVHLSNNTETAIAVGQRYGKPILLEIAADEMHKAGIAFFQSENGVWLTEHVAPEFIRFS